MYTTDDTLAEGKHIFHRLFWVFQPRIRGFAYCKPILQINGTWLYDKYKGTLLMAVAQDDNNNIFHVAFALVEGYALNQPTFHYYRSEIGMANANALRCIDSIPAEKWTRAFDGGRR
ncbi:unnamed protein product [Lathyrus sativus]|nr:unnamed protein product [Lathyrus sativus]